ncbi:MAG: LamG-like jellyroll fold domain-containing protein [Planctomycetota bacterium]
MPQLKPTRGILLNTHHPLTRGLVGCWLMNEGSGRKINDLTGFHVGNITGPIAWADRGIKFTRGTVNVANLGKTFTVGPNGTVIFWGKTNSMAHNYQNSVGVDGTTVDYFALRKGPSRWDIRDNASVDRTVNNSIVAGRRFMAAFVCDGTDWRYYEDGVLRDTTTYNTTINVSDFGNAYANDTNSFDGTFYELLIFDRILTAAEIAWLSREPFSVVERAIRPGLIGGPIVNLAGTLTALTSLSATAKAIRKVGGTVAGISNVAALLNSIRGEESSLEIERNWLGEALFNGMTANAFKLGTTLSLGWFWVRVAGCSVLYRGPSVERIDFTNILTVAEQNACDISPPSYIPHNNSSIYFYAIRRFSNCGYQELTLTAAAKVSIDANGELEKPQPSNIFSSKAEQVDGNKIQLVWFYCPLEQKSQPVCFNVYYDSGMGQIDYENPLATIGYKGRKFYSYQSGVLVAGSYLFTIRAEDADGVENSSSAQLKIQLDTTNPDAIKILSTETV